MKNLPESGMWDKMKNRLRDYNEEPDDNWDAILGGVNSQASSSTDLATKSLWVILILLVGWLGVPENLRGNFQSTRLSGNISAARKNDNKRVERNTVRENEVNGLPTQSTFLPPTESSSNVADLSSKSLLDSKAFESISSREFNNELTANENVTPPDNELNEIEKSVTNDGSYSDKQSDLMLSTTRESSPEETVDTTVVDSETTAALETRVAVKMNEEKKKDQRKRKPLLAYFSVTPSLAYYKITPNRKDEVQLAELKSSGIFSSDRVGFTIDAGLHRQLSRNLEGYAGISYYQQRQQITYTYFSEEGSSVKSNNGLNYGVVPGIQARSISYSMKNLGITAGVLYTLKRATLNHQLGFGLHYQYGFSQANSESSIQNNAVSYVNYQVLYRLRWNMSERLDFYLQPSYTSGLTTQEIEGQPFSIRPARAGIGFGLIYFVQ